MPVLLIALLLAMSLALGSRTLSPSEPGILGVNAGAALGVILAISALGLPEIGQYTPFALLGAGCAAAAVYTISHRTIETGSLASSWPESP